MMRRLRKRLLGVAAAVAALVLVPGMLAGPAVASAGAKSNQDRFNYCGNNAMVREKLKNGTEWRMCWRMDTKASLVLERVGYLPKGEKYPITVMKSAQLAQLNVPYDTGEHQWNDITSYGFGGYYSHAIAPKECPNGKLKGQWIGKKEDAKKVLCVQKVDSGPAYRSQEQEWMSPDLGDLFTAQGQDLVLYTISKVDWYEYITQWRFSDNGQLSARLGATGDLSPEDWTTPDMGWPVGKNATGVAANHFHNATWRVDFDLDGEGGEKVEQYDTLATGVAGNRAEILKTVKTDITREGSYNSANMRWWRVVSPTAKNKDGHAMSYELVQGAGQTYTPSPVQSPAVSFSQAKPCEKFASFNNDPECGAQDIPGYVKTPEKLTDPLMWVTIGFHHVPRDEDQSPMPVHWQGFDLMPRDVTAMNPLTPNARKTHNGEVG